MCMLLVLRPFWETQFRATVLCQRISFGAKRAIEILQERLMHQCASIPSCWMKLS